MAEHSERCCWAFPLITSKDKLYRETYLAKGPRGVVEMTAGEDDIERMTSTTFNSHLAALSTFWNFAKLEAMVVPDAPSIFQGLHIPIKKGRKSPIQVFEERPIWSRKFMRAVFTSNLFYGCGARNKWRQKGDLVFRDERYWGVLKGPHQGLRREELFQLNVKHIRYEPAVKIWHVDLQDKDLRLKDSESPRLVPLHENILELGFIEARVKGRRPDEYLFPEATPSAVDKKRGDYFGKFFHHFRSDIIDRMDDNEPFDPSDIGDDNGTPLADSYLEVVPPPTVKGAIDRILFNENRSATTVSKGLWQNLTFWRGLTAVAFAMLIFTIAVPLTTQRPSVISAQLMASITPKGSDVSYLAYYDPLTRQLSLSHLSGERGAGRDFELWAIEGQAKPVSLGVVPVGNIVRMRIEPEIGRRLANGGILAISTEPPGGSPTGQATGPVVAAGDLHQI